MCIIIDTNVFGDIFNKESKLHDRFEPVLNWILHGKGKIVYGGTKYIAELGKTPKYQKLFNELQKKRKTVKVADDMVDHREKEIKKIKQHSDFNDAHLIAIVIESGCRLVCTKDSRAVPFIKDRVFYPKFSKRPKIYWGKHNEDLLTDCNIAPICR
jgi:predicted nucleic acid-binding protein